MLLTTRPMSWRTEPSRSLVPGLPWKYLLATMFVAVCDQLLGTSTSSWRKIVTPFSLPISAVRFSHSTLSNGEIFPSVKNRSNTSPRTPVSGEACASNDLPLSAGFTVAILFLHTPEFRHVRGTPIVYSSARGRVCATQKSPSQKVRRLACPSDNGRPREAHATSERPQKRKTVSRPEKENALPWAGSSSTQPQSRRPDLPSWESRNFTTCDRGTVGALGFFA